MSANALPNDPAPIAGGGEPPYHEEMDRRLTILETRFDTLLPTLATKADLDLLRAEFRVEMGTLRSEFHFKLEKLRSEFHVEMEKLRSEFHVEMEKLRVEFHSALREQTKWIVKLVLTLFLGMLGINMAMWSSLKNSVDSLQSIIAVGQRNSAQPVPAPKQAVPVP